MRGPSRVVDEPQPGYFLIRLIKKGPRVPARICHDFGHWWAEINGKPVGEKTEDVLTANQVIQIWTYGVFISEAEYRRLLALPDAEKPDPLKVVDLRKKGSIF